MNKSDFIIKKLQRLPVGKRVEMLKRFAMKYYPNEQLADEEIAQAGRAVQMFEIEIEHLSGKEVQEK